MLLSQLPTCQHEVESVLAADVLYLLALYPSAVFVLYLLSLYPSAVFVLYLLALYPSAVRLREV